MSACEGTLLSSYLTLDGLRRLGYRLTAEESEAYLHCWNVVGHIMGIRPELQPTDFADAAALRLEALTSTAAL